MTVTGREAYSGTRSETSDLREGEREGTSRLGGGRGWGAGHGQQGRTGQQRRTEHGPGAGRGGEGGGRGGEGAGELGPRSTGAVRTGPSPVTVRGPQRDGVPGEGFTLRLCLDLQLDAMLLTVGAAALGASALGAAAREAAEAGRCTRPQGGASQEPAWEPDDVTGGLRAIPGRRWRSWLDEDIDVAYRLAAEVVASGVSLPATLGPDPTRNVPSGLLDDLTARYEAMWSLLDDIDHCGPPRAGGIGTRVPDGAREHCRKRLDWLRRARRATPIDRVPAGVSAPFLPGELLG
jgi:hypothetical protein